MHRTARHRLEECVRDVVLSLGSDFLACGPGAIRHAREFSRRRRSSEESPSRLYVVESTPTLTGAKADHRLPLSSSRLDRFARAMASRVGALASPGSALPAIEEKWIGAVARDLLAHRGASIVAAGEHEPPSVHAAALAMNHALGNVGGTVYEHGALFGPLVASGDWWRVVTSGFLHASFWHVALNMVFIWFIGRSLEPAISTARFVVAYGASLFRVLGSYPRAVQ